MDKYIVQVKLWDGEWKSVKGYHDSKEKAQKKALELWTSYKPETVFDVKIEELDKKLT